MKNVALVTCFLNNYGACLQALALQHEIESLGHNCKILAYVEPQGYRVEDDFIMFKRRLRNYIGRIIHFRQRSGQVDAVKFHDAFYKYRKKYLKFDCAKGTKKTIFYNSFEDLRDVHNRFDAFVCGSDQIWNPIFYRQNHPVYHLRFAGEKPRIAYAPSIGLSKFPEEYSETFKTYIADFDYLSIREQAGADIIKDLCAKDAEVVLDPTLLAGAEFWNSVVKSKAKVPYREYIACYIFSNTKRAAEYIKKVQETTGLPVVYFNISDLDYSALDAYCCTYASPVDFLNVIKNSKFVLTDSFHGTAFSIIFNKEFYVFAREQKEFSVDMISRIHSILNMTGLENRLISLDEPFEYKENIDYSEANLKLAEVRKKSKKFLATALGD